MGTILTGRINLSKIREELVKRNAAGEAFVWVDVSERREPSQYGDTHNISIYDSANRQKIYIGELRPRELGTSASGDAPPKGMGSSYKGSDGKWHPLSEIIQPAPDYPCYKPMSGKDEDDQDIPF